MIVTIRDIMIAESTITNLVGTRIYPEVLPQASIMPAIVLTMADEADQVTHEGDKGLLNGEVDFDFYGNTWLQVQAVWVATRDFLNGYKGGVTQGIFLVRSRGLYDKESGLRHRTATFNIWSK